MAAKQKNAAGEPKRTAKKITPGMIMPPERKPAPANASLSSGHGAALAPKPVAGKTRDERLRTMIGQLLIAGFEGKRAAEPDVAHISAALREGKLSGVIVSDANVESFSQLQQLLAVFRNGKDDNFPLIALEQPGGADAVLGEDKGFKLYAAANLVANDRGPYDAQLLYRDMAGELAGLGVNLNIGPSADICSEGGVNLSALCFGTTPSQVAAYATAFNSGHHDRGVLTALKHVPFTSGSQTSPIYEPANIALFREVARRGPSDAIVVRLKAAEPSSVPYWAFRFHAISKSNNKRIFRRPNSEATLIVDLDAGSRGAPVRQGEAIVRALQLGGDAILIRDGSKIQGDLTIVAYDAVRAAVESNRLDMARVEEAYQRVQRLKARLRAFQHRTLTVQSEAPRSELH